VTETVADLAARAVRDRSESVLLGAFVAAGRGAAEEEARGDLRDGLIDMPLPFDAAGLLGLDADELVGRAADRLEQRAAELLRQFAGRPDRADISAMGWRTAAGGRFAYEWRPDG
jgi:hypothetical protein